MKRQTDRFVRRETKDEVREIWLRRMRTRQTQICNCVVFFADLMFFFELTNFVSFFLKKKKILTCNMVFELLSICNCHHFWRDDTFGLLLLMNLFWTSQAS